MTTLFRSQSISIDKGSVIAGRYEVVDLVGTGGMGVVLRVIDRELNDEVVALKILHSHLAQDKNVFRRFRNEVLVARSLTHPNIIRIHDIGRAEEGSYSYISMEFVDGVSLKERLQTVSEDGEIIRTPLPLDEALTVLYQILGGVSYAHGKGVIHRDLKPANVMISKINEIKLADFGMARILSVENSLTQAGQMLGTPDYMSPEQIRGEVLDAACDIYALGIVAYELVVGRCPFQADSSVALAFKHLSEPIAPFASAANGIPKWFEDAVLKACAKSKDDRFKSVMEFATVLVENSPQIIYQTGVFSIEGTRHLSTASLGRAVKSPVNGADVPTDSGTRRFEMGEVKAGEREEWSLEGGSSGMPHAARKRRSNGAGLILGLLALAAAAGGGYWYKVIRPADEAATAVQLSAIDKQKLEDELMDFNPAGNSAHLPKKSGSDAIPAATEKPIAVPVQSPAQNLVSIPGQDDLPTALTPEIEKPPVEPNSASASSSGTEPVAVNPGNGSLNSSSGAAQAVVPVSGPTPLPSLPTGPIATPPAGDSTAVIVAPTTEVKHDILTSVTTSVLPVTTTVPALTASLTLKEHGTVLSDRIITKDRIRDITFAGVVNGIPTGDREGRERVLDSLSIGLIDLRGGRTLSKPGFETLPGDSPGAVRVSGGVGGAILPAGEYKLALNFSGKTIAVRQFSIEEPHIAPPVSTVATTVPVSIRPPAGSSNPGLPPPNRPGGEQPVPVTPTTVLPGSGSQIGMPTGPGDGTVIVQPPSIQHESYSGNLMLQSDSGGSDESRAFGLEIDINGDQISGSANVAGFEPFQVQGQVLPRGIELHLNNSTLGARLSGGKRDRVLKGRFTMSDQHKGSWEVRRSN